MIIFLWHYNLTTSRRPHHAEKLIVSVCDSDGARLFAFMLSRYLINFLVHILQITCTMVALWHHLRRARRSKFRRYGLLNNHIIPDATLCYHINCLFPVEDEQRLRTHNVHVIFCIRCHLTDFRVRVVQMSTLKRISL